MPSNIPPPGQVQQYDVQFVADDIAIVGGVSVVAFLRCEDETVCWLVELGRLYPRVP